MVYKDQIIPQEEIKNEFIRLSFKIDENRILNQEEKLKEETVKLLFVDKFSGLAANQEHYGKNRCFKSHHK